MMHQIESIFNELENIEKKKKNNLGGSYRIESKINS